MSLLDNGGRSGRLVLPLKNAISSKPSSRAKIMILEWFVSDELSLINGDILREKYCWFHCRRRFATSLYSGRSGMPLTIHAVDSALIPWSLISSSSTDSEVTFVFAQSSLFGRIVVFWFWFISGSLAKRIRFSSFEQSEFETSSFRDHQTADFHSSTRIGSRLRSGIETS